MVLYYSKKIEHSIEKETEAVINNFALTKKYEVLALHRFRKSTDFTFLGKQMNYLQANHSFVFYGSRQIREKCFSAPVSLQPLIFLAMRLL